MIDQRGTTRDSRIKRVGDIYYARFSRRGVRIEQSLDTSNFKLALDLVDSIERAILTGGDYRELFDDSLRPENKGKLICDLWPMFMKDRVTGTTKVTKLREKTLKEYSGFYTRYYEPFFGNRKASEIDPDLWGEFILFVEAKSKKGTSLKKFNLWKYLSGFCKWCVLNGHLKEMPEIYNPDPNDGEDGAGKNYTDDELKTFKKKSQAMGEAFHLWIMLSMSMGMRSSEITQLHKNRIDLKNSVVALKKQDTKTKTARKIPIHPSVLLILKAQLEATKRSHYLFPNRADSSRPMDTTGFKKPWKQIREENGIEGRFHDLRHSYATRIFANPNVNPVMAAKALGMSMKVAMEVYIHYTDEQLLSLTSGISV